jgi:hypothetical protein
MPDGVDNFTMGWVEYGLHDWPSYSWRMFIWGNWP